MSAMMMKKLALTAATVKAAGFKGSLAPPKGEKPAKGSAKSKLEATAVQVTNLTFLGN
jgi:hypothetical protein